SCSGVSAPPLADVTTTSPGRDSEETKSAASSAARVDSAFEGNDAAASLVWTELSLPCACPPTAPMPNQIPSTARMASPRRTPDLFLLSMLSIVDDDESRCNLRTWR